MLRIIVLIAVGLVVYGAFAWLFWHVLHGALVGKVKKQAKVCRMSDAYITMTREVAKNPLPIYEL